MNIEKALNTPGWMSESELMYLASIAEKSYSIAEIGSWRGRSARALAENTHGTVLCVDTWADNAYGAVFPGDAPDLCQHPDWLWREFSKNTADLSNIESIRLSSVRGAEACSGRLFDLIFIDAGHNYDDVVADIKSWRPLLRPGGVLCGHDYATFHEPVMRAVNELVPSFRVVGTIWTTEDL